MYMYVCVYIHISMYICVYIMHRFVYIYIYASTCTCTVIYIYMKIELHMQACICIQTQTRSGLLLALSSAGCAALPPQWPRRLQRFWVLDICHMSSGQNFWEKLSGHGIPRQLSKSLDTCGLFWSCPGDIRTLVWPMSVLNIALVSRILTFANIPGRAIGPYPQAPTVPFFLVTLHFGLFGS